MNVRPKALLVIAVLASVPVVTGGSFQNPEVTDAMGEGHPDILKVWVDSGTADTFDIVILTAVPAHGFLEEGPSRQMAYSVDYCLASNNVTQCYRAGATGPAGQGTAWALAPPSQGAVYFWDCVPQLGSTAVKEVGILRAAALGDIVRITLLRGEHDVTAVSYLGSTCQSVTRGGPGISEGDTLSCLTARSWGDLGPFDVTAGFPGIVAVGDQAGACGTGDFTFCADAPGNRPPHANASSPARCGS